MKIKEQTTQRIQDSCRALKPEIGEQAAALWLGYIFEDDKEREEMESDIDLLTNATLHKDVDNITPVFIPPKAEKASGEFTLGTVAYNGKLLHPFGLRASEMFQHLAIFGRSGAGKTNLGFLLVKTLGENGIPFLHFDWKRNMRDMLAVPGFEHLSVYTIGRDVAPFRYNPLIPPQNVDPKTWLKHLTYAIAASYFLGDGCVWLITTVLDHVYRQAGVYSGKATSWPTFRDVLKVLQSIPARGREALWQASALRAIGSLCFGQIDDIVNSSPNARLDGILERQVVFEMESLAQADKVFFVQSILLWLHMGKVAGEMKREQLSSMVIIEEAHHILSKRMSSNSSVGESIMDTVFRELREFGVGITLLDQHPSEMSLPALGNTFTTISMNLKSRQDVTTMASAMLLDLEQEKVLGNMEVGKAIVKLQGRIPEPFMIHVPHVKIEKGFVTDAMLKEKMLAQTPPGIPGADGLPRDALTEEELTILTSQPVDESSSEEEAFLDDVRQHPDSGVAARYKRLGLSVRQGDRIKRALLARGLLTESVQRTTTGQKKVLTGKARNSTVG